MAQFADRMTSLTRTLRTSIQMRNDARQQVHDATADLSKRTQTFMAHVAEQNRTRAEELRESLAAHREECRQKTEDLRGEHRESLEKMRTDMNHMLTETRKSRHDTVNQQVHTFQHARNELALDLREASLAWHGFATGRDHTDTAEARSHTKPTVSVQAEMTPHATPKSRAKPGPTAHAATTTPRGPAKPSRMEPKAGAKARVKPRRGK
jgi:hypothetical protein